MIVFFYDICKCFFHFFKILVFWVVMGGVSKWQKMTQNNKRNLSHSVSQEQYLIWLWFLIHMCKMMISPVFFFFFIFQNFNFSGFSKSSINAKRKFWGSPHLLHTCVIFCYDCNRQSKGKLEDQNKTHFICKFSKFIWWKNKHTRK